MYFEDEKENMKDSSALDELDVDIDNDDDKSVTWDDLLDDDSDIDVGTIKKGASVNDALLDDADDSELLEDDTTIGELSPAPQRHAGTPRRDAFDVFGGSASQTLESYSPSDSYGDTITPDLTRRSTRSRTAFGGDDDIYFEPSKAKKSSSGIFTTLVGILLAFGLVGGLIYVFITYGKSLTGFDVESLKKAVNPVQETQMPDVNNNQPSIDINAPADVNANAGANKEQTDEKAKEEEKKAEKFVTLSVQNDGRINPFAPPAGFENSTAKYAFSDYEILSPPEEVPTDETAQEAKKLMNITVSGILFDSVKPSAIISVSGSDYFVQIGDKVDEFQVIAINTQYVAIKNGTNVYRAQVGENFNNSAKVSGMAQRQSSGKFAGAKQYTSVSDVEVSVKDEY